MEKAEETLASVILSLDEVERRLGKIRLDVIYLQKEVAAIHKTMDEIGALPEEG
jgi:hypothetical protein